MCCVRWWHLHWKSLESLEKSSHLLAVEFLLCCEYPRWVLKRDTKTLTSWTHSQKALHQPLLRFPLRPRLWPCVQVPFWPHSATLSLQPRSTIKCECIALLRLPGEGLFPGHLGDPWEGLRCGSSLLWFTPSLSCWPPPHLLLRRLTAGSRKGQAGPFLQHKVPPVNGHDFLGEPQGELLRYLLTVVCKSLPWGASISLRTVGSGSENGLRLETGWQHPVHPLQWLISALSLPALEFLQLFESSYSLTGYLLISSAP